MKRKQLLFAFLAFVLATVACAINFNSAKIDDAWTASNEAGDQRATTFEQDDTVYVKVELGSAPDDTKVKAVFSTVDVEGDEDNKLIDDHELTSGSGTLTFTLSNTKLWPAGTYKAELFLNDKLDRTLNFDVKASQTAQVTPPAPTQVAPTQAAPTLPPTTEGSVTTARITRAFMAHDENGNEPATRFQPDEVVYTIFDLEAPQGASMKAVWVAKDAQDLALNTILEELPFDMQTSGRNWVSYSPTAGEPWKPGRYQVELYVNNALSQALDFTIEEASSPDSGSITGAYTAFDQDGNSPTTVFGPNDIFYCIVDFSTSGLVSIRAEWYAVDTQESQNSLIDSYTADVSGTGSTWFSLSSGTWSVGTYRVDLYVNDQYSMTVDFEVQ
jgi:hypothetical protein